MIHQNRDSDNRIHVKYAVIILNYNTLSDAINAAKSVIECSCTKDYIICIADNNTNNNDSYVLKNVHMNNTITLQIDKNEGYAKGNNQAIRYVNNYYIADYYVVMNPDVCLLKKNTIETLINHIENSKISGIVGAQPLVWNCNLDQPPEEQINIRRIPNKMDLLLLEFSPLRKVFVKKYEKFCYLNYRPYRNRIRFSVPSGAFFIIDSTCFQKIGLFDENTFLYGEEFIIGYKLKSLNSFFLFVPSIKVKHQHGASIGNNRFNVNKNAQNFKLLSHLYYAKKYLNASSAFSLFLSVMSRIDYYIRVLYSKMINR